MRRVPVLNGSPMEHVFITGPDQFWIRRWCREHGVNPGARNVRMLTTRTSLDALRGWRDVLLVATGYGSYHCLHGFTDEQHAALAPIKAADYVETVELVSV